MTSYTFALKITLCILLDVLIETGSAAVRCDANRPKAVCRTVERVIFFIKVTDLHLLVSLA